MTGIVLIIVLLLTILPVNAFSFFSRNNKGLYKFDIAKVIDGDTIKVYIKDFPEALRQVSIRIAGIDTPEIGSKARCVKEAKLANQARDFVIKFLDSSKKVRFKPLGYGKYGRILADVYADDRNLATELVNANLAIAYSGGHRENYWCG